MNLSQIERLILVKDIMDNSGELSVEDVVQRFCNRSGEERSSKVKGIVRRDLESLHSNINYLNKKHFTPSDEEINPDDLSKYKNTRTVYSLIDYNSEVYGDKKLRESGGCIVSPSKNSLEWRLQNLSSDFSKDHLSFSMRLKENGYISLSIKKDDLPLKLIIGRKNGNVVPRIQEVQASFGKRTSLLLLNEAGIERTQKNVSMGHCLIEFEKTPNMIKVRDLGSKLGTFISRYKRTTAYQEKPKLTNDLELNNILYQASNEVNDMKIPKIEPFSLNRKWEKVGLDFVTCETPCYVCIGKFSLYVSLV